MAGRIFSQESTAVLTLQDGASGVLSNNSQVLAATANLDNRSGGNAGTIGGNSVGELIMATFQLTGGFGSSPLVGAILNLYLIPAIDGTNFADYDTTNHNMPPACFVGSFLVNKAQTAAQVMVIAGVPLSPILYHAVLDNQSGQQLSAGWTLSVLAEDTQYT